MKTLIVLASVLIIGAAPVCAKGPAVDGRGTATVKGCRPGVYGAESGAFVVIGPVLSPSAPGQRYLFLDGVRGNTGAPDASVTCTNDVATVRLPTGQKENRYRRPLRETDVAFESAATSLAGRLLEPPGSADATRPLVVMVHGSEKTPSLENVYAYMLAAQGISVFVYDKRGTGLSAGEYTQNFELLAEDAAAALDQATRMAAGRFGRAGFFGGSQGGWVAPLAATRSAADFVAVGFGLVTSPIDEDREQLLDEARRLGLDGKSLSQVKRLSDATAELVRSHFTTGFEQLADVRREIGNLPWAKTVKGEYSGDMLRMSDADLRRIGRARFDNLELIWDYDATAALAGLKVPLLWILAGEDREAPIAATSAVLKRRISEGQTIDAFIFPDTDHGMMEFRVDAEGTRSVTKITDGYLRLLGDWIKQDLRGPYGRAQELR
jgi:pimeloyl-ACP methyl ester carboxylesterase